MSSDDIPSVRFAGRTYSRKKKSTDEGSSVQVKAAVSLSKWGKANYVPYREESEPAGSQPKKTKVNVSTDSDDPFQFDFEDKSKSPAKKRQGDRSTLLPASRIDIKSEIKSEGGYGQGESSLRTYSKTALKKEKKEEEEEEDEQFIKVGQSVVNRKGDRVFLVNKGDDEVKEEDDDDIFPVEFKRDPLKTYGGEVVTPVDKPESPPLNRKGGYVKKGGQRGRKPLIVSDPGLIEQYKKHYAEQQQKGRTDSDTGGLNNSMVVSKQELANEELGKTVVVVCKPKTQLEKSDVQNKYFTRTPRKHGLTVLETGTSSSELSASQASPNINNNGDAQLSLSTPASDTSPSGSVSQKSDVTPSPAANTGRRLTRGRLSNNEWTSQSNSATSDISNQSDNSGGRAKRYRIFKTRAQAESKPESIADEESPIPDNHMQQVTPSAEEMSSTPIANDEAEVEGDKMENEFSQGTDIVSTVDDTPSSLEVDTDQTVSNQSLVSCVKTLATRLKGNEKGNDSDSTEQDNASECSDNLLSQESPANSQSTDKEDDCAPRRFFKSKKSLSNSSDLKRKMFSSSPQKSPAKATYNARSWQSENDDGDEREEAAMKTRHHGLNRDDDMVLVRDSSKAPRLSREVHWPERNFDEAYTSLKVNKKHKELYTVVHNVKQTHEVQELGETQDFIDDVDYLLDSLRSTNSTSIRCLSCLKLAGKCIIPAFRMHLRAHGTVAKIFSLLHDACTDASLALSTSTMMFMLSRDRLNMDLDQESLELMLKLNEVDVAEKEKATDSLKEVEKIKERVKELLAQLQQETHAREIDLDFVSTGNLAMESLLSLTSRRAGEWFKEELRSVGGLDHIVDSVVSSCRQLSDNMGDNIQSALPNLRKLDRCLRVLENVSYMNSDNQVHLVNYKNSALLVSCGRILHVCQKHMPSFKVLETVEENKAVRDLPGFTILTTIMAVLRLLLNITHEHKAQSFSSSDERNLLETGLRCLINTQWCIPAEQRFDLAVLSLGLLINLIEKSVDNRKSIMEIQMEVRDSEEKKPCRMSAVQAIVNLFHQREVAAREMEESTNGAAADTSNSESPNKSGEWKETEVGIQWITNNLKKAKEEQEKQEKMAANTSVEQQESETETSEGNQSILEDDEETFTKALHKAGKHMENSIVASYAGLLLGWSMMDNENYIFTVKSIIPGHDFRPMIKILKKFLNFMSLTTAFGSTDVNGITKVIDLLESA